MMQSNPMMQILMAAKSGKNPMGMMRQMAAQDPRVAQTMQIINGKSPKEQEMIARNMARERGINIDQMIRQLGLF